jgi:hypothetical protein
MAKFSMKKGGKEVGPASVYAKPHTMSGKAGTGAKVMQDPNKLAADKMTNRTATPRVSMGDPAADDVKTTGIKVRGTGAATKGLMARGPMA